uniref:RING-type domain-containing protein n=1 Tax=Cuerna arida TaxID=1464854 RepID=A0A1B6GPE6_9HEMI
MPVILLERLPLPSLKAYTVISAVLLSCSVYYAVHVTSDPSWKNNSTSIINIETLEAVKNDSYDVMGGLSKKLSSLGVFITDIVTFMIQEPLCIWTLINTAYCTLILLGKFIQRLVFGELRVSEQQHLKDKFWNFVFYKFIFVFGVINVQYMDEVVMWCAWFSLLGSLHLLAQLCKDRFEYLSFSPTTPGWSHLRLVALLAAILCLSGIMFLICVAVGLLYAGLNTFAFMAAECVLLSVRTLHTLLRYALHVYDVRGGGGRVWEKRGALAYYTELVFELGALLIELLHHVHMLLWSNIFLSMASLVICMHLRYLIHEIQRRFKKHRNYLWVLYHMEQSYPMASTTELAENSDNCAICWEKMESARKLPCTHLFHNSCLQSWLEQDTSCPTCRLALSIHNLASASSQLSEPANLPPNRPRPNHFFHFDGSRYVSWLPSFSVEVTHTQLLHTNQPTHTSQLDAMARTVQQLFPHLPLSVIIDDLHITHSVELTVENVLEGHVQAPLQSPPPSPPTPTTTSPPPLTWQHTTSSESAEEDDEPLNAGSRFSKSPSERERILHVRKEKLLLGARRRYLERHPTTS